MIALAIQLLWVLIGIIVICGIIWLVMYGIETIAGIPIPPRVKQGVWFIVLILILIGILTVLAGGGSGLRPFRLGQLSTVIAFLPAGIATYLQG